MASVRAFRGLVGYRTSIISGKPVYGLPCYFNTELSGRHMSQKINSGISKVENSGSQVQTSFAEVVKENTKSAWYMSVIIGGAGVTAFILYAIFKELFSGKSPNGVYSQAVERCMKEPKVLDALGEPVKAYGEESRRGRRRHVSHTTYEHNGKVYMRMKFYIQGSRKKGTVHLEVKEDDSGKFGYRYLFIQLDDMLRNVIVVEDNRAAEMETNKIEDIAPFNFPILSS